VKESSCWHEPASPNCCWLEGIVEYQLEGDPLNGFDSWLILFPRVILDVRISLVKLRGAVLKVEAVEAAGFSRRPPTDQAHPCGKLR